METEPVFRRLNQSREEIRRQPQKDAALVGLRSAEKKIRACDVAGYMETLRQNLQVIGETMLEPPEPYQLTDLDKDILTATDSFPFGFIELDPFATVPRSALSVIAGKTGQGKTTFMLNLLARWMTSPRLAKQRFYFFSYEEPRSHIALKLIMIWSGVELHRMQNFNAYLAYYKNERGTNKPIDEAIEMYEEMAGSGRLLIDDSMPNAEDLALVLGNIGKRPGVGAVMIDDIQSVSPVDWRATKVEAVATTAQILRKTAVSADLAIITGSQISDAGEMREIKDIVYEAALVLKLNQEPRNEISLLVEKQRAGSAGSVVTISFEKPLLRMGYLKSHSRQVERLVIKEEESAIFSTSKRTNIGMPSFARNVR
jgi:replicative DNA helicase